VGRPEILTSLEGVGAFFFGILAFGCLMNWLREWRHDPNGRIFFTIVTALGFLIVAALVFDIVRRHASS